MKLSVLIVTYNHEKFISQALDSALMQETNFDYEIVIGEDCSTDNTRWIILEYQERHPEKIRLLPSESNIGSQRNFVRTLQACRGEYIALLDGDDYWTSPSKLQRQVDFLDSHRECVMCFHDVENIYEGDEPSSPVFIPVDRNEILTIKDILVYDFIPTLSVVFRNGLIGEMPGWYWRLPFGDWPLFVLLAQFGHIGYINETMGAYRRRSEAATAGGAWTGSRREVFWQGELATYHYLSRYLDGRYSRLIRAAVSLRYYMLAAHFEETGNLTKARTYALRRAITRPFDSQSEQPLKHLIRLYMPAPLYRLARSCKRAVIGH